MNAHLRGPVLGDGGMEGCLDAARMWHACNDVISPWTVRHFGREKKKITDNFRPDRSGAESSH